MPTHQPQCFSIPAAAAVETYSAWLERHFPSYITIPFALYHHEFWAWVWALSPSQRADAFVAIWPRGAGKSTSAELACAAVAARGTRTYALYVCETQDQANQHVENVAALFESGSFGDRYVEVSSRLVGKYGNSRGWRVNRLRTASGFTIDAIGLDKSARGIKVDDSRPDLIILDDIDGELDTAQTIEKKLATLTKRIIPTQGPHCAILAVQNLVHQDGVFARLADGRADFLADRHVSGPHKAIEGLETTLVDGSYRITGGEPSWATVEFWQHQLREMGLTAFMAECQHEVEAPAGGMFDHLTFRHCDWDAVSLGQLESTVCWVDPAVTDKDGSDAHGITVAGIDTDHRNIYILHSWEQRSTPTKTLTRAIALAQQFKCNHVGVETDQGGDTWRELYWQLTRSLGIISPPAFRENKAGAGFGPKTHRASQMLVDYEKGRIVHLYGTHETVERALRRFPKTKPYDLVDSQFWAWNDLRSTFGDPNEAYANVVPEVLPAIETARESPWKRARELVTA